MARPRALAVDLEDSQTSTIEEELAHAETFPGRFVLTQSISARHSSQSAAQPIQPTHTRP